VKGASAKEKLFYRKEETKSGAKWDCRWKPNRALEGHERLCLQESSMFEDINKFLP